jgi:hypothetical protein
MVEAQDTYSTAEEEGGGGESDQDQWEALDFDIEVRDLKG